MTTYGGYDTAALINQVYSYAVSKYGKPTFWMRYFSPCPNTAFNESSANANTECDAAWDSGGPVLGPICDPSGSREASNSSAEGQADAQTFAAALLNVYHWVGPLQKPSTGTIYCWLDVEESSSLSLNYWNAWAGFIAGYPWDDDSYPLYACLYCQPCAAHPTCSTVQNGAACTAVWTSEPQKCSNTLNSLPTFTSAYNCNSCGVANNVPTTLWQFADQTPICSQITVDVDLDASGGSMSSRAFVLSSRP
jgi:hypothetical protein